MTMLPPDSAQPVERESFGFDPVNEGIPLEKSKMTGLKHLREKLALSKINKSVIN